MGILRPDHASDPGSYKLPEDGGFISFSCAPEFEMIAGTCYRSPGTYYDDTASLIACCTNPDPMVQHDCKPGYCPGSAGCTNLFSTACSASFLTEGPCKAWCLSNPGKCDQGARKYCKEHPTDADFCACLNSPLANIVDGKPSNPACFDGVCISKGYQTAEMKKNAEHCGDYCASVVQCIQQTGGTCNIDAISFQNVCGKSPTPADKCTSDVSCGAGKYCVNGTCTSTPPKPARCSSDAACPKGQVCVDGSCVDAPVPASPLAAILIILIAILALIIVSAALRWVRRPKKETIGGTKAAGMPQIAV